MAKLAAKPTAHVAGAGWTNPADAYDETYGNESNTAATGARTKSTSGSQTTTLVLSAFVDPGGLVPAFVKVRLKYSINETDGVGSFCKIEYALNGVDYTIMALKQAGDVENNADASVYQASATGATIADVTVRITLSAVSDGGISTAIAYVFDVWMEGPGSSTARASCNSFLG